MSVLIQLPWNDWSLCVSRQKKKSLKNPHKNHKNEFCPFFSDETALRLSKKYPGLSPFVYKEMFNVSEEDQKIIYNFGLRIKKLGLKPEDFFGLVPKGNGYYAYKTDQEIEEILKKHEQIIAKKVSLVQYAEKFKILEKNLLKIIWEFY